MFPSQFYAGYIPPSYEEPPTVEEIAPVEVDLKCSCDIMVLMARGCVCGHIQLERKMKDCKKENCEASIFDPCC